jgi:excisionase family DNA binding protein
MLSEGRSYSPRQFRERHNISNTTLYDQIKKGRLVALKVGRRTIITEEAEKDWLASLPKVKEVA